MNQKPLIPVLTAIIVIKYLLVLNLYVSSIRGNPIKKSFFIADFTKVTIRENLKNLLHQDSPWTAT